MEVSGVRPSVVRLHEHFQLTSPLKPRTDSFHISHIASIGRGTNNCVFCSGRIRTLVAMATYSFHRLIMGN